MSAVYNRKRALALVSNSFSLTLSLKFIRSKLASAYGAAMADIRVGTHKAIPSALSL